MYKSLFLLFLTLPVFALEVMITTAEEERKMYSIMHLSHEEPFVCKTDVDHFGKTNEIVCTFEKRPTNRFTRSENLFFKITSDIRGGNFNVRITPKKKVKLFPLNHDLKRAPTIETKEAQISNYWQIIGYEDKIPFLNPQQSTGINFPISIETHHAPAIGALDIGKHPLVFDEARDIPEYLRAKQMMEDENYFQALFSIDDILKNYPDSIFTKELHLFKIRALYNMKENKERWDDIVELGKAWIKQYPADEHVTEVLVILADTYGKMGFQNESRYYFDRIFTEHEGEKFEKMAKIVLANHQYAKGDTARALKLYEEALTETRDLDIASLAASNLAEKLLEKKKVGEAVSLYEKVFDANPHYFLKDTEVTYELAQTIAAEGNYDFPARLARAVLTKTNSTDDLYEALIRDIGIWEDEAGHMRRAYTFYSRYTDEFFKGKFYPEVKERLDRLMFAMDEDNSTKRMQQFDYIMEEYPAGDLAKRALEEKIKLLYEQKKYESVLQFEDQIKSSEDNTTKEEDKNYIYDSALALAQKAVDEQDCKSALRYMIDYELTLDSQNDMFMFDCAYNSALYDVASTFTSRHLNEKEPVARLAWMRKHLSILLYENKHMQVLNLGKDILAMAQMLKTDEYNDVVYDMFNAAAQLERKEQMVDLASQIESEFPGSQNNIAPYKKIVQLALNDKDDVMTATYAKKIMDIQDDKEIGIESPWVEFIYMETMIRLKKDEDAIATADRLMNMELEEKDKAKTLYWQGFLYQKTDKSADAQASYETCSQIEAQTPWVKLCKDALKLMQ